MRSDPDKTPFPELSRGSAHDPGPAKRFPEIKGYQIIEELPRGGQAIVYKATHLATKAKVALKVLHPDFHHSPHAKRYFEQEVELAAGLHHPNIVSIRDSGLHQGLYYFAMEYIRGESLDVYVKAKDLSLKDKLILFTKICDAMAHAHLRGVIHRDLKPSNILVDERTEPHVLDFGLAKSTGILHRQTDASDIPTLTGEIRGTLAYMSPEQAEGRPDLIDVRTDVYTLGVLLYRMLTNEFPYDVSGSALKTLETIRSADPIRPKNIIKKLDSDIEAIVLKCLAKAQEKRYQSAAELRDEVKRWMEGLPILAKSVSSVYLLRKVMSRHRYASMTAACLLIILASFSSIFYRLSGTLKQRNIELTATKGLISERDYEYGFLSSQIYFSRWLDLWHLDRRSELQLMARYSADGTREAIAQQFLQDPRPPAEKIPEFRKQLGEINRFFQDFVIAELYIKRGQIDQAKASLKECLASADQSAESDNSVDNAYLQMRAKVRLYELTNQSTPTGL